MILAALYVAVLIAGATVLGILWTAYKGFTHIQQQLKTGEKAVK